MNEIADDFAQAVPARAKHVKARSPEDLLTARDACMCSLCGVLGGNEHWTDAAARPGVFTRNVEPPAAPARAGASRRLANRVLGLYGLTLTDWQGSSFILSTATGKTEMVEDLGHLWAAAERLLGRPCDPLDPDLIDRGWRRASG